MDKSSHAFFHQIISKISKVKCSRQTGQFTFNGWLNIKLYNLFHLWMKCLIWTCASQNVPIFVGNCRKKYHTKLLKRICVRANWTRKCVLHRKSIGAHCWKIIVQSIAFASLDWELGKHALLLCCCYSLVDLFSLDLTHWLSNKIRGARWCWVLNRHIFPHFQANDTKILWIQSTKYANWKKNNKMIENLLGKNFENTKDSQKIQITWKSCHLLIR